MSVKRISGKEVRSYVGDYEVIAEKLNLKIDDKREVAYLRGVPNGYLDGETAADGSITLDSQHFTMLVDGLIAEYGTFQDIPPLDIKFFASAGGLTKDLDAFGCLLKISDLWDSEGAGGKKTEHTIPFSITSPDFIHIDGAPYLSVKSVENIF